MRLDVSKQVLVFVECLVADLARVHGVIPCNYNCVIPRNYNYYQFKPPCIYLVLTLTKDYCYRQIPVLTFANSAP